MLEATEPDEWPPSAWDRLSRKRSAATSTPFLVRVLDLDAGVGAHRSVLQSTGLGAHGSHQLRSLRTTGFGIVPG